jgi:tetratricopeptide (TPR) repeat protein
MKFRFAVWMVLLLMAQGALASADLEKVNCPSISWARSALAYPISKNAFAHVKPGDPARKLLINAKLWPRQCPGDDISWYLILRARELLGCDPRRTLALAEEAYRAAPRSVWVATIRARLRGSLSSAEEAAALDPDHFSAQLALIWALLNEGQTERAAKVLRKLKSLRVPGSRGLSARLYLAKDDARGALKEAAAEGPVGSGGDIILPEATAGLDWPWIDPQVAALASAKLGRAKEAAQWLSGIPAGTLPELRAEVTSHTKTAEQLMDAMARTVENVREEDVVRDAMAVSLARLRVIAGQSVLATALVSTNPRRLERFCTSLSELLWTAGLDKSKDAVVDRLRATCTPEAPNAQPLTEPAECRVD